MSGIVRSLDIVIYPNAPLSGNQLRAITAIFVAVSSMSIAGFAWLGAWPVSGFLGLDVIGLITALWWTKRQSRIRERIRIRSDQFLVERVKPTGQTIIEMFNPAWVKIENDERRSGLRIGYGNRFVSVGKFLTRAEVSALRNELRNALGV